MSSLAEIPGRLPRILSEKRERAWTADHEDRATEARHVTHFVVGGKGRRA
jgi:hypothetical protein